MANRTVPTAAKAARRAAADSVCCALGDVVSHHRRAAGFTQVDLAAVVGVTQHMVSYWEAGRALMGTHHLLLVAARLRVPAEVLLADAWADASPCARLLVPAPAGDPVLLRWRRPPARPRRPEPADPGPPSGDLAGLLRAAGMPTAEAARAYLFYDGPAPVCEVGWQKGECHHRPTRVAVRVNRTRRWDDSPARLVVRAVCPDHADRLDRGVWVIVDLPAPPEPEVDQADDVTAARRAGRARRGSYRH